MLGCCKAVSLPLENGNRIGVRGSTERVMSDEKLEMNIDNRQSFFGSECHNNSKRDREMAVCPTSDRNEMAVSRFERIRCVR